MDIITRATIEQPVSLSWDLKIKQSPVPECFRLVNFTFIKAEMPVNLPIYVAQNKCFMRFFPKG
jgi:hypothetical protein